MKTPSEKSLYPHVKSFRINELQQAALMRLRGGNMCSCRRVDPRSWAKRWHHAHERSMSRAVAKAVQASGIAKMIAPNQTLQLVDEHFG